MSNATQRSPFRAFFEAKIKSENKMKKQRVCGELIVQLDAFNQANNPRIRLVNSKTNGDCDGIVRFPGLTGGVDRVEGFVIENVGEVVANIEFIPKSDESTVCKPWIRIVPERASIRAKESIQVQIFVNVGEEIVELSESSEIRLDDVLLLRVENGRDYFLVIDAAFTKNKMAEHGDRALPA